MGADDGGEGNAEGRGRPGGSPQGEYFGPITLVGTAAHAQPGVLEVNVRPRVVGRTAGIGEAHLRGWAATIEVSTLPGLGQC